MNKLILLVVLLLVSCVGPGQAIARSNVLIYVKDSAGAPLVGAWTGICYNNCRVSTPSFALTDARGAALFKGVPVGAYQFIVVSSPSDYQASPATATLASAYVTVTPVQLPRAWTYNFRTGITPTAFCGDGRCTAPEDLNSCPQDCKRCGDNICTVPFENLQNCARDCHVCGDTICSSPYEDSMNCPIDCPPPLAGPSCGDGVCNVPAEDSFSCPQDCPPTPPPMCTSAAQCNDANPCTADTCASGTCMNTLFAPCCGNVVCEPGETYSSCSSDCPPPSAPSCSDGIKNGDETGLDCGGTCSTTAQGSKLCTEGDDCNPFGNVMECASTRCDQATGKCSRAYGDYLCSSCILGASGPATYSCRGAGCGSATIAYNHCTGGPSGTGLGSCQKPCWLQPPMTGVSATHTAYCDAISPALGDQCATNPITGNYPMGPPLCLRGPPSATPCTADAQCAEFKCVSGSCATPTTCTDSDSSITTKGTVTNDWNSYTDQCVGSTFTYNPSLGIPLRTTHVKEGTCGVSPTNQQNAIVKSITACPSPNYCEDGACRTPTCTDDDGGNDLTKKGSVTSDGQVWMQKSTDRCEVGVPSSIREYTCNVDGSIKETLTSCPAGTPLCSDGACIQSVDWVRQWGTASADYARGVVEVGGNAYVTGVQFSANEIFVRKYDSTGALVWSREFGTSNPDEAYAITADSTGIYVAGITAGAFSGTNAGGYDIFVRKYDFDGNVVWTGQAGTAGVDYAYGVAVDTTGVYLTGFTTGTFSGQSRVVPGGTDQDGFVVKFDLAGNFVFARQFGTSTVDVSQGIAADGANVYAVGYTQGALTGTNSGYTDVFVRKYDSSGNVVWTRQFGTSASDWGFGITADLAGVYAVGATQGALSGSNLGGPNDAFMRKFKADGTVEWTQQFGTSAQDRANAVDIGATGIYVTGFTTGVMATSTGTYADAFVRKYDGAGSALWTRQFGTSQADDALGISANSAVFVSGSASGTFPGQTSASAFIHDAYLAKLTG